jgi:hypothetical protein
MKMDMETNTEQLRHAGDGVAKLKGLLPGASEQYCHVVIATLSHFTDFKTLFSQAVEFILLSPAKQAGRSSYFIRGCHYAIFPSLCLGLCGGAGENSPGIAIYDCAQKNASHEDYERPDTFMHTSPCFEVIDSARRG